MSTQDSQSDWCPNEPETSEPQDRKQLAGHSVASSLCHTGWRPLFITGVIRDLLIRHFSDKSYIEEPDLRAAVWKNVPPSGILIESVYRYTPEEVENRPAVLIKRNSYKNYRYLLNDRLGPDEEGFENYSTLWVGSHTLFCIHQKGAATELLATEVQRELTQFGPVVTNSLDLHKFMVQNVGTISIVEESTQNFIVPITLAWAYQENWRVLPDSLPLQGIHLDLS